MFSRFGLLLIIIVITCFFSSDRHFVVPPQMPAAAAPPWAAGLCVGSIKKPITLKNYVIVILLFVIDISQCDSDPCGVNAYCEEKQGSYDCHCDDGYSGIPYVMCTGETLVT